MGKFIKIVRIGKTLRLTIPKEFHFLFNSVDLVNL